MMDIILVILLALVGIIMLLLVLFLLPGFGIAGISGFAALVGSVVVAYVRIGATAGHIALAACIVLAGLAVYGFVRSHALERMALDTTIDSSVDLAAPGKKIDNLNAEAEKINK